MLLYGLFQAKALAEKNMRDLLAQKEQAERNVKSSKYAGGNFLQFNKGLKYCSYCSYSFILDRD